MGRPKPLCRVVLIGMLLVLPAMIGCAGKAPRGKAYVKGDNTSSYRLTYFNPSELRAKIESGDMKPEKKAKALAEVSKGGRVIYRGLNILMNEFGGYGDPWLEVRQGGKDVKLDCSAWHSVQGLGIGMRQVKSRITCDIVDTLSGNFEAFLMQNKKSHIERFEVFPDSTPPPAKPPGG